MAEEEASSSCPWRIDRLRFGLNFKHSLRSKIKILGRALVVVCLSWTGVKIIRSIQIASKFESHWEKLPDSQIGELSNLELPSVSWRFWEPKNVHQKWTLSKSVHLRDVHFWNPPEICDVAMMPGNRSSCNFHFQTIRRNASRQGN